MLQHMKVDGSRPRAQVGIVGAGQLARMTLQAAIPLDVHVRLLAARPDDGAARVAADVMLGDPDDPAAVSALAASCDVVTFDHELVPFPLLAELERRGVILRPSAAVMALAQDKRRQRETFAALNLPVPPFAVLTRSEQAVECGGRWGWPIVIKAARGGYDGRGVWVLHDAAAATSLTASLIAAGIEPVAERWVPIEREVAILVARRPNGETVAYPLVETVQIDGICREILAPAQVPEPLARETVRLAETIATASEVVGILAVECFVSEGTLLINEIATRPHNSGHYSIEGCVTSQFEQHLRAILDWPLGQASLTAPAVATVNVLGNAAGDDPRAFLPAALAIPGVHVHLYGKTPRPGRKLGHVTVCGDHLEDVRERAQRAAAILGAPLPQGVRA
jgi:5-(carboxyamino)imidazole ribonucleotide synthase